MLNKCINKSIALGIHTLIILIIMIQLNPSNLDNLGSLFPYLGGLRLVHQAMQSKWMVTSCIKWFVIVNKHVLICTVLLESQFGKVKDVYSAFFYLQSSWSSFSSCNATIFNSYQHFWIPYLDTTNAFTYHYILSHLKWKLPVLVMKLRYNDDTP